MSSSTLDELRCALTSILNGEEVDVARIEGLMKQVRSCVPGTNVAEVRRLQAEVSKLEIVIRDRYQEVAEELRRLGQGRQALRGYNHIRGHEQAQRLYRRA